MGFSLMCTGKEIRLHFTGCLTTELLTIWEAKGLGLPDLGHSF